MKWYIKNGYKKLEYTSHQQKNSQYLVLIYMDIWKTRRNDISKKLKFDMFFQPQSRKEVTRLLSFFFFLTSHLLSLSICQIGGRQKKFIPQAPYKSYRSCCSAFNHLKSYYNKQLSICCSPNLIFKSSIVLRKKPQKYFREKWNLVSSCSVAIPYAALKSSFKLTVLQAAELTKLF